MARQGAQYANLIRRSKGWAQESNRMQVSQPLTIGNIGSSAGNILEVTRIYKAHLEPTDFQNLEQRDPVDAGGLHCHSLDPACLQPICQAMEILRECGE